MVKLVTTFLSTFLFYGKFTFNVALQAFIIRGARRAKLWTYVLLAHYWNEQQIM
uniref:Uncharacterized protein n=1 Tax=Spironucleus salmonicida TaxID=348837 RepID=V6LDY7_9EUKA|eukprot:EST41906.1 Hypothetical protein SS50377_18209 [Spironucleus salmonicida]